MVLLYAQSPTNSRLFFLIYFTAGHNFVLNLGFTSTRQKKVNIYICWQTSIKRDCMTVLVMNSKMSPVRCSLRKRVIASLRNSHTSTAFLMCPLKFLCPVSTGHKDNSIQTNSLNISDVN